MTTRYTWPTVWFFDPETLLALESGVTRPTESVSVTSRLDGVGDIEVTYPYPFDNGTYGHVAFGVLEAIGNVIMVGYGDLRYAAGAGQAKYFGDCYRIESVVVEDRPNAGPLVRIKGRSLIAELEDIPVWTPIGDVSTYSTSVKTDHPIPAPTTSTVTTDYSAGATSLTLADGSTFKVDDMVIIPLTGGGTLITTVSSKDDETPNVIEIENALPGAVADNTVVTRRTRKIIPTSTNGIAVGSKCVITLNSGTFTTLVEREPQEEEDQLVVLLRDGVTGAANAGNTIVFSDTSRPADDDITQILANAPGWTSTLAGSANGSAHVPEGASVFELLQAVSDISNSPFRQSYTTGTPQPARKIKWGVASGPTGRVVFYNPTSQASIAVFDMGVNRAIVYGTIAEELKRNIVTRIYPTGGDPGVSLYGVSDTVRDALAVFGYQIVDDPDVLGLYEEPYMYNSDLEPEDIVAKKVTFGDIMPETKGVASAYQSSDELAWRAMYWLQEHNAEYREFRISGAEVASSATVPLEVGQWVDLQRYYDVQKESAYENVLYEALTTLEVTMRWSAGDTFPRYDVTLSTIARKPTDGARAMVSSLRNYNRMARRIATGRDTGDVRYVGSTSSSSTSGALPLSGGHMTGNITLSSGLTVDGIDISAHAANASAHHAPVTATDGTIALSGQAVSVALDTGRSITLATGIGVNLNASGGLEHSSNSLRIKTHTDSGLQVSAGGVRLVPEGVSASTGNTVTTIYHSHQVVANSDVIAGASALLKSDTGQLSLRRLGIGVVADSSAALYVKAVSAGNKSVWIKQVAGQTGDMLRIEDQWGDPLIRLTGGGDLESGTPQYTSGLVGWQIAADGSAEFNNVRVRGELHAATFVADEITAAGGTIIVKTAGTIGPPQATGHNVIPALNASFYLVVKKSWDTAANYFPVGSILRVKTMGEVVSGGSLDLFDLYMEVTAVAAYDDRDLANGEAGNIRLTCTFRHGGTMNGSSGDATGFEIPAGSAVVLWTEVGASGYTGAIKLTTDGDVVNDETEAPLIDIFTVGKKTSASWGGVIPTLTPRVRIGNLRGVLGKTSDEWGMAAGTNLGDGSDDAPRIVASDLGVNLYNVNLSMYSGSTEVMRLDPSVPSFGLGSTLPTGTQAGGDGFWVGHIGSNKYAVRVGGIYSYAPQLLWDGNSNTLSLRDKTGAEKIVFDASGNSYFAGPMTLGTNGGIWQGTGTFASPTTGLKIWRDGTAGRLATYNGGTAQVYLDTNGYFFAGGGKVKVAADGLTLESYAAPGTGWYSVYDSPLALKFRKADGTYTGHIASLTNGSVHNVSITAGGSGSGHHILVSTAGITLDTTGTIQIGNVASDASTIYFDGDIVQNSGTASFSFAGMALNPHTVSASYEIVSGNAVFAGTFLKAGTGITVGENVVSTPGNGTILIDGLASAPSAPSGTEVALYVVLSGSTYTLYMKKPGGSTVTIASV